ncbi:MAG: hypothetical protein J6O90_01250 [Candidatus Methanomethylophilaceae archaeon]|nr:hypothetical protein [Candidatus Methanomethylophilaceae archaeon]
MRFRKIKRLLRDLFDFSRNRIYTGDTSVCLKDPLAKMQHCRIKLDGDSRLNLKPGVRLDHVRIQIADGSCLTIAAGTILCDVDICIWNHSSVSIGERCDIRTVRMVVENGKAEIGSDNHMSPGEKAEMPCINVSHGSIFIEDHNNLKNTIWVRFGGVLHIGRFNCINEGTELRCDDSIRIGSFNMISYNCDIWDTNTHSRYTLEEKQEMFAGTFPKIGLEKVKPKTLPVVIGDGNWIGKYACILKGTRIGNNVSVGTRAIASNMDLEDGRTLVPEKSTVL